MRGEKRINRRISGLHNLWRERVCNLLRRKLSAGVVDGAGRGEDELGDGEDGVAVVDEAGEDSGQRLRCVEGGVVEQHDAAGCTLEVTRRQMVSAS